MRRTPVPSSLVVVALAFAPACVVGACKRVPEIVSTNPGGAPRQADSDATSPAAQTAAGSSTGSPSTTAPALALTLTVSPSGAASTSTSASSSASAATGSASALVGAIPGSTAADLVARIVGFWAFSHFDLNDPNTKTLWEAVPADMKKEVLDSAPQATLEITRDTFVMRLLGVPEKKNPFTIDPALSASAVGGAFDTVTLMTDNGRKRVRVIDNDTIRVEELDRKEDFVTIFARKKSDPAPVVSGTPKGK